MAQRAGACANTPPMKWYANSDRPRPCPSLLVQEQVVARVGVLYVEVDVPAAPRAVRKRLRHVRRYCAMLQGVLARHHLEERVPVGRGQCIVVNEIDLVLAVGVLVVRLVDVPAHAGHPVHQVFQVVHHVRDALEVVARLRQCVHAVGVPDVYRAVFLARHQEVLRLDADVELVPLVPARAEHALQVLPGAVGVDLVVYEQVACKSCDALAPRNERIGVEVYPRQHVVGVGPLPQSPEGRAREPRALVDHVVQVRLRHHLHLRRAVYVHELHEDILHPVGRHTLSDFLSRGHWLYSLLGRPRRCSQSGRAALGAGPVAAAPDRSDTVSHPVRRGHRRSPFLYEAGGLARAGRLDIIHWASLASTLGM